MAERPRSWLGDPDCSARVDAFDLLPDGEQVVDGADEEQASGEEPEDAFADPAEVEVLQSCDEHEAEQGQSERDAFFFGRVHGSHDRIIARNTTFQKAHLVVWREFRRIRLSGSHLRVAFLR